MSLSALDRANNRLGTELNGKINQLKQDLELMIQQLVQEFKEQLQRRRIGTIPRWMSG